MQITRPQSPASLGEPFRGLRGESDPPGAFGSFAAAKEHKVLLLFQKKQFASFLKKHLNPGIGGKPAVNRNGDAGDKSRRVIIQQEI